VRDARCAVRACGQAATTETSVRSGSTTAAAHIVCEPHAAQLAAMAAQVMALFTLNSNETR
jgi:hypothetical protein